jgi:hypothetical protein
MDFQFVILDNKSLLILSEVTVVPWLVAMPDDIRINGQDNIGSVRNWRSKDAGGRRNHGAAG